MRSHSKHPFRPKLTQMVAKNLCALIVKNSLLYFCPTKQSSGAVSMRYDMNLTHTIIGPFVLNLLAIISQPL